MSQIISGGFDAFESAVFGRPHVNTINFLQNQFDFDSSAISGAASAFMDTARSMFERVNSSDAMRLARAAVHRVQSMWLSNELQELTKLAHFQHAPVVMQRFIMAEPTIRKLYLEQACDGYSDSYVNVHGNAIGEQHYDYRLVTDGLMVIPDLEKDPDAPWTITCYQEDLLEGDQELMLAEQVDIRNTWGNMAVEISTHRIDPTSKYNASL
jgi:hypothetical protein